MRGLDDLLKDGVRGRRVLLRADLNVPLEGSVITDDGRIRATVPTVRTLAEAGAKVVVTAHLGRPDGEPDPRYSLAPVAKRLGELLERPVALANDITGHSARKTVGSLTDGGVALLENVRFDARETAKDEERRGAFADELVALVGDGAAFVSDGFGVVHRRQTSVYDVATRLPAYAGTLVVDELAALRRLVDDPDRPYVVVLGGSKVSDKLGVIEALLPNVDRLLVGGGMCFTFLAAQGYGVGGSLLESDQVETCRRLLAEHVGADGAAKIVLPIDVVCADAVVADAEIHVLPVDGIPDSLKGLDIGPNTVTLFSAELAGARTVFWNGPMGVFEVAPFAGGTRGVATAIAESSAYSVVGGGDSAAAVRLLDVDEAGFSHISTGGGASLEFLEGRTLPGLAVLEG